MLADQAKIDEEFRVAWLPNFCRSGQRDTSLEEFAVEAEDWSFSLRFSLSALTGKVLAGESSFFPLRSRRLG